MKLTEEKKIHFLSLTILILAIFTSLSFLAYANHLNYLKDSPYDVVVSDIQANTVTISWKTENDMPSYIKLNESEKLLGSEEPSKFHRVTVVELDSESLYKFRISDGERDWNEDVVGHSSELEQFALFSYQFKTTKLKESILLPEVVELHVLPNELIYVSLFDSSKNQYSEIKSYYANKFGGVAVDTRSFLGEWDFEKVKVQNIGYFSTQNIRASLAKIYASEINCNQNISPQKINGITKTEFAQLATRWVAGRGKHYAIECFDDVVYRSKMAGVDPAFTLAVWLNESGASNYTQDMDSYGYIEDWGIHGREDVPTHNFSAQINHFLKRGHSNVCPGLTRWEAWGNIYRWGTCNTNNPAARQEGIDYYKKIESLYRWITNGKRLPNKVTGLPIPINESQQWSEAPQSLCCALKLKGSDVLMGDFEGNVNQSCNEIWESGESAFSSTVEYAVEIPNSNVDICEVSYEGVCCQLSNDVKWYPKVVCDSPVEGINSNTECKEYAKEMACFLRDGLYKWLPEAIGTDYIKGVSSGTQCESRNNVKTYKIELKEGVNFVGFDFSPSYKAEPMYASILLEKNKDIELIGNFQGYEWKDLVKQSEKIPFVGQDFFFEQNRGYLIIAKKDLVIELDGWKNPEAQYQDLEDGWNLVGGSIYSKPSKASSLISNLEQSNIDIDTVGVWAYDLGLFIFRREENTGDVYGVDISLEDNQGIFIKK